MGQREERIQAIERKPEIIEVSGSFHETLDRPAPPLPPDRSTGLVFAAMALVIAFIFRGNPAIFAVALLVAAVLAVVSFVAPSILHPLNVAWMRFAMLLGKVMNPIVMLVLFAVAIIPAGLIMQRFRDPLRRRRNEAGTYWLPVGQAGQSGGSTMKHQF